ncbi:hypothetical protein GOV08_00920 [Candidatus Woesearchaeota archaeon]|nr:hypothetical protein [Candidatus Woesearchaeota archaeon]
MYNNNYNENKVLSFFFEKPTTRFHIRELAKLAKIHPNTIIKITDSLEQKEYITKKRYKNLVEAQANTESNKFVRAKKFFNIFKIYDSGVVDQLISYYKPKAIILYGSYSRGEDFEKSDIDLVVITKEKKQINKTHYEKKLDKEIHLTLIDYTKISKEFYTNLINGHVLHGYLELK